MSANYFVRFVSRNGKMIPELVDLPQPRRLEIRNLADFTEEIVDGAQFSVALVEMRGGTARVPALLVLALENKITSVQPHDFGNEFWIRPEYVLLMNADVRFGRAVRLVGPKGTGKTTFAALFAKKLGVPFLKVDGTGIFKPKDLFGAETGSDGTLKWNPSDFSKFLAEHRFADREVKGVICLDEFSRMGHSMAPFHALFDHTHHFSFTTCDGTIVIDRLEGFVFILTDNPVGQGYVGNQELDTAMEDRVESYEFSYPPPEWEIPWLGAMTGIQKPVATRIVEIANEARHLATKNYWQKGGPSPRRTLCVAQDVSIGTDLDLSIMHRIVSRYQDGETGSERSQLVAILQAKGFTLRHVLSESAKATTHDFVV